MTATALVFLLGLLALPLYLMQRSWRRQPDPWREGDLVLWGIGAFMAAVIVTMVTVWHLVARYPVLDNESYVIGLLVFLLLIFFDLLLLPPLAQIKAREGPLKAAVLWSLWFFLGGLLVASSLVGGFALLSWFVTEYPGFLDPWGRIFRALVALLVAVYLFRLFERQQRARKARRSGSDPALEGKNPPEDFPALGVGAFFLALALSMVATWMIVARYPVAQDDAFALGLLGTQFVLFSVLLFLPRRGGLKAREGSRRAAVRWGMGFVLKGVLVAPLVGVSLWLLHRLATENLWAPVALTWVILGLQLVSQRIWLARSARGRAEEVPPV